MHFYHCLLFTILIKLRFTLQADSLAVLLDDVLLEPDNSVEEASDLCSQESPKEHILEYLAGYVVKKFSSLKCSSCVATLKSERVPAGLILARSKGHLQVPSNKLLTLLKIVEHHLELFTIEKVACANAYMSIVEGVLLDDRTASAAVGCSLHFISITAEIIHFFLRTRLHFFTREKNKRMRASVRTTCPASGGKKSACPK